MPKITTLRGYVKYGILRPSQKQFHYDQLSICRIKAAQIWVQILISSFFERYHMLNFTLTRYLQILDRKISMWPKTNFHSFWKYLKLSWIESVLVWTPIRSPFLLLLGDKFKGSNLRVIISIIKRVDRLLDRSFETLIRFPIVLYFHPNPDCWPKN